MGVFRNENAAAPQLWESQQQEKCSRAMLARVAAIKQSGVNVIVLLALSDAGRPGWWIAN